MSDVRARAEARRAKILARGTENKSIKQVGDEDDGPSLTPTTEKVDRPIAARKQRIESAREEEPPVLTDKGDDEVNTETIPEKPIKTMQQIEEEVRQRTAEFDAKVLAEGILAEKDKEKKEALEKKKAVAKAKASASAPAGNGIKIFRAVLIISLGAITGYRAISSDSTIRGLLLQKYTSPVSRVVQPQDDSTALEGDEFVAYQTLTNDKIRVDPEPVLRSLQTEKTWSRWVTKKLRRQMETSMSAVSLVGWIVYFSQPMLSGVLGVTPAVATKTNMMGKLWGLLSGGFGGLVDPAVNYLGEVTLHTFSAMLTSFALNRYYEEMDAAVEAGDEAQVEAPAELVGVGGDQDEL